MLKKQLKRAQILPFFANLVPCTIGMEACGGAHDWARKLQSLGHEVRLIAPQYVKPFVKRNKNVAVVALANKNARTIWALLAHDSGVRPRLCEGGRIIHSATEHNTNRLRKENLHREYRQS